MQEPLLAKPGAGLPLVEKLVAKYYFVGFRFRRLKWEEAAARTLREARDRASPLKHPHPWFGPITAHQWNWLMAAHQSVHRRQLEKLLSA